MKTALLLPSWAGVLVLVGCGDDATGRTPVEQPYSPMAVGDFWVWDYDHVQDLAGSQNDSTEMGTWMWTVDQIVTHPGGELYRVTVADSIVFFFQSIPVDTAVYSNIEYYRVRDDYVRYYYSLQDTTFWLDLDLPLHQGGAWCDVEDALHTVISVDTTLNALDHKPHEMDPCTEIR